MAKRAQKISEDFVAEAQSGKVAEKKYKREWMVTLGWYVLLVAGLGHMFPTQMGPLLSWKLGVTLQFAIGMVALIVALYYLLGNEE